MRGELFHEDRRKDRRDYMTKLVVAFVHIFGERSAERKAASRVIIGSKLPGFLPRRSVLGSRQVQVGLAVYTVEIWQDFLRVINFGFPMSLSFHQCSLLRINSSTTGHI